MVFSYFWVFVLLQIIIMLGKKEIYVTKLFIIVNDFEQSR